MSDPDHLIGRYAKVVECTDETWSGEHVEVRSYHSEDGKYEVATTLNSIHDEVSKTYLYSTQLKLFSPKSFSSRFPTAPVIVGRHDMSELPVGCVADFSQCDPSIVAIAPNLQIKGSCRVVGNRGLNDENRRNTINNHIVVDAKADDLIEIEDMLFKSENWGVQCFAGNVVFRSCAFYYRRNAVLANGPASGLCVTFENCVFNKHKETAVWILGGGVTIVNCSFHGVDVAIAVNGEESRLTCECTNFRDCSAGINVQKGQAYIADCGFDRTADYCVLATQGAEVTTSRCFATACTNCAVVVEGCVYKNTTASLTKWEFKDCKTAVRTGNGNLHVVCDSLLLDSCKLGTFLGTDATGYVTLINCVDPQIMNMSGDLCHVNVNGVEEPEGTQRQRVAEQFELQGRLGIPYSFRLPLHTRSKRLLTKMGIFKMSCVNCQAIAPRDAIFKICAYCCEARYCSRECQKAHWPVHSAQCSAFMLRAMILEEKGYVPCQACGKVEIYGKGVSHTACSKCVNVVYCSKTCQTSSWPEHKKLCKSLKNYSKK